MGKLWHVKLNGRVIFGDGWKDFCEEVEVGYFLVFRLVEAAEVAGLAFDVLVFDQTTCTRDYPHFHHVKDETPEEEEEEDHDEDDDEMPNESAGELRNKEKDINFEQKPGSYVPQHPYFVFNLSSYCAKTSVLYIPNKFARENGLYNRSCSIVLVDERENEWLAELGLYPQSNQAHIKRCWYAFRCANSLKAGDSCIFELVQNGKKPVIKLTKCPEGFKPKPEIKRHPNNNNRAGFRLRKPYVFVTVKPYHFKLCLLRIPTAFAVNSSFERKLPEEVVIRNERDQSWTVSTWRSKTGSINLGQGWITFARSNGIKVGDVLKLQLIKTGNKPVVKIFGVSRTSKNYNKISHENSLETLKKMSSQ